VGFRAHRSLAVLKRILSRPFELNDGIRVKLNVWEAEVSPIRKLITRCNISFGGWFHCEGREASDLEIISSLPNEWIINWLTIKPVPEELCATWYTSPGLLVFDIETYSSRHNAFPDLWNPEHHAYMISCIYQRVGSSERLRYAVVKGTCKKEGLPSNTTLFEVETEEQMIRMFAAIIQHHQPEIITGYNINDFDWEYLDARLHLYNEQWPIFGRMLNRRPKMYRDDWKSDGYGQNNISMLSVPGMITIDALSVIKRDYKMASYKLDVVAQYFVGKSKHAITPQQMFEIYESNMKAVSLKKRLEFTTPEEREECENEIEAASRKMMEVMCYCIQDSELVLDILDKVHFWIASLQMSSVAGVCIEDLYLRGQQQRCFSQLYDLATRSGVVLDSQPPPENTKYKGGHVCEPVRGVHDNVITLDFTSLYPSIIIGFNICYTTLVPPYMESRIDPKECNVIEITEDPEDEAKGKKKDTKNKQEAQSGSQVQQPPPAPPKTRSYSYIKGPQGILPRLVHRLIDERNKVKQQIKKTTDPLQLVVLDKKQLALKVTANSVYGFLGTGTRGIRPLMEAAECITAKGRWLISEVNKYLKNKYNANIVYGDTDSSMIVLPFIKESKECLEWGHKLAKEVSILFPPPVKMEFEKACRMLLLDKKMYVGLYISPEGGFAMKKGSYDLLVRGVLIARRDNCKWSRDVYRSLVEMALTRIPLLKVMLHFISEAKKLMNGEVPIEDLSIVKTLGSNYTNESYQMKVFADNLRRLGRPAQPGDRLFYLIVKDKDAHLLGERMVTPEMYLDSQREGEVAYKIDYLYYLDKVLSSHVDKLISVAYAEELLKWKWLQYRPTNQHGYTGLDRLAHTVSRLVQHGGSIDTLEQLILHPPPGCMEVEAQQ